MQTTSSKTGFTWLRFSVRFLLLLIFLAACVLGWISWKIQTAKAELQFAREHVAAGNQVFWSHFEGQQQTWPEPGWNYDWMRNHWSSHVSNLRIYDWKMTSLQSLKRFKQLTELRLTCPMLTDVEALKQVPNLETLDILGCEHLQSLRPVGGLRKLTSLAVHDCVGLTEIAAIGECKELKTLAISNCDFTNDLSFIANLQNLESLNLTYLPNTQTIDIKFVNAPGLKELRLASFPLLGDLDPLVAFSKLESVTLYNLDRLQNIDGLKNCSDLINLFCSNCPLLQNVDGLIQRHWFDGDQSSRLPTTTADRWLAESCFHQTTDDSVECAD